MRFVIEDDLLQISECVFLQYLNVLLKKLNLECMPIKGLLKGLIRFLGSTRHFAKSIIADNVGRWLVRLKGVLCGKDFIQRKFIRLRR